MSSALRTTTTGRASTSSETSAASIENELSPLPKILKARTPLYTRADVTRAPEVSAIGPALARAPSLASQLSQAGGGFVDAAAAGPAFNELAREASHMSVLSGASRTSRASRIGVGFAVKGDTEGNSGSEPYDEKEVDKEQETAVQTAPDGTEITFPDGGLHAWLCVVGGAGTLFCAFGLSAAAGAFQTYYSTHQLAAYSSSSVSWIGSVMIFVTFAGSAFSGSLFDLYGHRPLMASGTFLVVLGYCMLSLSTKYYQIFLCHATLIAVGSNLMFISPLAVTAQWFAKRRGLAFGLMMTGGALGSTLWPIIWANAPEKIGFPWTMRMIALIVLILGSSGFFLLRTRLPPKPRGKFFALSAFKMLPYTMVALSSLTYVWGFFVWMFFIGTYGQLKGLGELALYLLPITNAASLCGRLFAGLVGDKIGGFNMVLVSNLVMSLCYWILLGVDNTPGLLVIDVLFGFVAGTFVSLQAPMVAVLVPDMRLGGTYIGQVMLFQAVGQLLAPPITGAILGHGSAEEQLANFPHAIILGAIMLLIASGCIAVARWKINPKLRAVV